ncbi:MAG TPA: C45 family peptidase [Ruminiclostridium sp.]|nr:C45 family peptidase [Ruminiclostridium sp.]
MNMSLSGKIKKLLALCLIFILILQVGCTSKISLPASTVKSCSDDGVSITDKGNYYDVVIDFTKGMTHEQMGAAYAKCIKKMLPDYESILESYIDENLIKTEYKYALNRVDDITEQVNTEFKDEIDGLASGMSGGNNDVYGDKKISKHEMYLFNLFTDAVRGSQCSYISVFGSRSATGKTITGRNLDWYGGSQNQLPRIQAVITYIYPHKKVCSIGFLGYMGMLTGFDSDKVFAGILDSGTGAAYTSEGRRSYPLDLRYAMETKDSMNDVAEYMRDPKKLYAFNHIIGFSDPDSSVILENNFSGNGSSGQRVRRAIRTSDSKLNDNIKWGISDAVAAINCFMLYGNNDNYTQNKYNTKRWKSILNQFEKDGPTISVDEIKSMESFHTGSSPKLFSENGDIYNKMTIHSVIFQPDSMSLQIFFRPKDNRVNPSKPTYIDIPVFQ